MVVRSTTNSIAFPTAINCPTLMMPPVALASGGSMSDGQVGLRKEPDEVETLKLDQIDVKTYFGGLVKSFERNAA